MGIPRRDRRTRSAWLTGSATRWQLGPDATFGLEGSRQASDAGEADNRVTLRAALRF